MCVGVVESRGGGGTECPNILFRFANPLLSRHFTQKGAHAAAPQADRRCGFRHRLARRPELLLPTMRLAQDMANGETLRPPARLSDAFDIAFLVFPRDDAGAASASPIVQGGTG